jgi:hypothetical protein
MRRSWASRRRRRRARAGTCESFQILRGRDDVWTAYEYALPSQLAPSHGATTARCGQRRAISGVSERIVACFPADKALVARMRGALGSYTALQPFSTVLPLVEAIRGGTIAATVVIIDERSFESNEAVLRRIHAGFPSHPLVAYYNPRGLTPRHLLALARTGVSDLIQLDVDDGRHVFGRILDSAERTTHSQILCDRLSTDIPAAMRDVLRYALEHAGKSMNVAELASALGIHKRTLTWRLGHHRLPPARRLIFWCRLLVASLLLDEPGRTLDSVATQLNIRDGHVLGNMFFRYLNRGVAALRADGVSEEVIAAFRREIRTRSASLPLTLREG